MFKLGPIAGAKGDVTKIIVTPDFVFTANKIVATDTHETPGTGTRFGEVLVNGKSQRPKGGSKVLTVFFANGVKGNELRFDPCPKGKDITIDIHFEHECEWSGELLGTSP